MSKIQSSVHEGAIVDRFTDALVAGDADAARACLTDDAIVWHNFDAIAQDGKTAANGWQALFTYFTDHTFTDIRRAAIPGGFVQQHLMCATTLSGERVGWPIAIIVRLRDGKIARFEEYIDRPEGCGSTPTRSIHPGSPLCPSDNAYEAQGRRGLGGGLSRPVSVPDRKTEAWVTR